MEEKIPCAFCEQPDAELICENCCQTAYCSKECQVRDWNLEGDQHAWVCEELRLHALLMEGKITEAQFCGESLSGVGEEQLVGIRGGGGGFRFGGGRGFGWGGGGRGGGGGGGGGFARGGFPGPRPMFAPRRFAGPGRFRPGTFARSFRGARMRAPLRMARGAFLRTWFWTRGFLYWPLWYWYLSAYPPLLPFALLAFTTPWYIYYAHYLPYWEYDQQMSQWRQRTKPDYSYLRYATQNPGQNKELTAEELKVALATHTLTDAPSYLPDTPRAEYAPAEIPAAA